MVIKNSRSSTEDFPWITSDKHILLIPQTLLHRLTKRFYWLSQPIVDDRSISENHYPACVAI
jgi:hypothetical protein